MQNLYYIIAHDGTEVYDCTEEAESRMDSMEIMEQLHQRKIQRHNAKAKKAGKNPFRILAMVFSL